MTQDLVQLMGKGNEGFAVVKGLNTIYFGDIDRPTEMEYEKEFYGSLDKFASRQEFLDSTGFR